ncbi:RNA polymerase sigma factor [Chryseolinea lacunae]|uniref:Sigma-70 family RNA polymerase sigma factor n=1 Tax=Chryseolinea lacunae TaxID=2801331 RepID=A0ABS1KNU0_9BACT|nr:sigma-70 family RNA polymerase sigma factor [Chryseolinea lacunae]MBL0741119.1 sigma-70 family RNA polymerase sigma factor [Chryseolinea lacunae]
MNVAKNLSESADLSPQKGEVVSLQEHTLWRDFKSGDLSAYAVLYRKYFFALYTYGKKISTDHELVKDCVQDLFVKIWNNRENLSDTTSIKYYLFTSLKRKLLDNLRSAHHKNKADDDIADLVISDDEFLADDLSEDQREKVVRAISTLSKHQQQLIHMKFHEERTNQEISDALGITIQSVYNAVFKTLRTIRKQMLMVLALLLSL